MAIKKIEFDLDIGNFSFFIHVMQMDANIELVLFKLSNSFCSHQMIWNSDY